MKIVKSLLFIKIICFLILGLVIIGFFYFEPSFFLRILAVLLGIIGVIQINRMPEIPVLIILYLSLYDFYNVRYGLAIPTSVILIFTWLLAIFLVYALSRIHKYEESGGKDVILVYILTLGLIVVEFFLAMSLWPVDPKTKSLVITIIFYLASRLIYLNIHRVLNLKRAIGFIVVSLLILGGVITLSWYLGF